MTGTLETFGDIATGGIVAHAVDGRGRSPTDSHDAACADCGTPLVGAHCHRCGQAGHLHSTIHGFGHEILHGVFHFEGKVWKTLPMLAFHPGQLTRRYIDGQRTRFVSPTALFLFSVFLMFSVMSNLAHFGEGGATKAASEGIGNAATQLRTELKAKQAEIAGLQQARVAAAKTGQSTAAIDQRLADAGNEVAGLGFATRAVPGAAAGKSYVGRDRADAGDPRNWPWIGDAIDHIKDNPELVAYKMKSDAYKYSWALIPLSLPFLWLMFCWRRRFGLYDHAVFATYSLAFMSLLVVALTMLTSLIGGVIGGLAWAAFFLIPPVHMYKQLRYGYELRRFSALWRTAALLVVVSITSLLFFVLIAYLGGMG